LENHFKPRVVHENSLKNLEDNRTKEQISKAAKKRIRTAINWLYALSEDKKVKNPTTGKYYTFRLNFITLTLSAPQKHDDEYIKKYMLNRFLEVMRHEYNMKSYVWKAEAQENGNIHFHITSNRYIDYQRLRDIWNNIQEKHGYIDQYFATNGHKDPNSTDIHSIRKVRNLAAYLATYMTKNPTYRTIQGRQWYLSNNLSKVKGWTEVADQGISDEVTTLIDQKDTMFKEYDYSSVLYADVFNVDPAEYPRIYKAVTAIKSQYSPYIN